jgi:hypothetical protein
MSLDLRVGQGWSHRVGAALSWSHRTLPLVEVGPHRTPQVGVTLSSRCQPDAPVARRCPCDRDCQLLEVADP